MAFERNDRDYMVNWVEPLSVNRERPLSFARYPYQRDRQLLTGSCYVDRLVVRRRKNHFSIVWFALAVQYPRNKCLDVLLENVIGRFICLELDRVDVATGRIRWW